MDIKKLAKGNRVLVLDGFCKQCLPFLREFRNFGCEVTVLCSSRLDCGYASRLPHHKILVDVNLRETSESEPIITELVRSGKYDLVYPLFDGTVQLMAHHKEELSRYAIVCANDKDIFDAAFDKENVMRVCMENDIPCPKTIFGIESVDGIKEQNLMFPLIIKPRSLYGARGFHIFNTEKEMVDYVESRQVNLKDYVIQEFIPKGSRVIGGNLFIDKNGDIKSSYLYVCEHLYPEDGGTSTLNGILLRPDIKETCERLARQMNLRGIIGVDLMLDHRDNVGKVIEINVRPVHGITLGFINGVNHVQQVLEDAFGLPVTPMEITRTDTCLRIMQTDMLWWLSSKDRWKRWPGKLGYKHTKEQMFYWDDPLPWLAFLIDGVKDYRKKMLEKTSAYVPQNTNNQDTLAGGVGHKIHLLPDVQLQAA